MTQAATNLYPVPQTPNKMAIISPMLDRAQALILVTKDDVDMARAFGKDINAMIATITTDFKPTKQAIDAAKDVVLQQEKNHLEPLKKAKEIVGGKMADWDTSERNRIAEESRIRQQEEERRRQAALEVARKKLSTLMAGMTENQGALKILENMLNNPDTSDEEAEVIRVQIRQVQAKIDSTIERSQAIEQKVEEVSQPSAPVQSVNEIKTTTGVSQVKEITAINTKILLRYLANGDCIVDPDAVIEWKRGPLKQLIQKMNLPGCSWEYVSKARF